jgi:hypothetical protein
MIIATDFARFTILLWFLTWTCKGDPVIAGSILQLREEKEFIVTVIIKLHLGGQNVTREGVYMAKMLYEKGFTALCAIYRQYNNGRGTNFSRIIYYFVVLMWKFRAWHVASY